MSELKAPFPWFGGKSRAAPLIWARLGRCANYVEPFAGSLAVLLGNPRPCATETVNDIDGLLANFWRALQSAPDELARLVDWPVNEADLHARHVYLVEQRGDLTERLMGDPRFFDVELAAWWVWGISAWIGGGWCSGDGPWRREGGRLVKGDSGRGVNRQLPHLGDAGQGVNRKLPHLGDAGQGVNRKWDPTALAERVRAVRVACGDWSRICGPSVLRVGSPCGVVLDPPYDDGATVYAQNHRVSADVRAWARDAGRDLSLRIALCGYSGEHDELAAWGWTVEEWKTKGGYGNLGDGEGRENATRERIWFSPGCLPPEQARLL